MYTLVVCSLVRVFSSQVLKWRWQSWKSPVLLALLDLWKCVEVCGKVVARKGMCGRKAVCAGSVCGKEREGSVKKSKCGTVWNAVEAK